MLKQQLNIKLQQKLSPLQIQVIKMLEYPTVELEERIREELINNPALEANDYEEHENNEENMLDERVEKQERDDEFDWVWDDDSYEDTSDYRLNISNRSPDDEHVNREISTNESFRESLITQLSTLAIDDDIRELAEYIIDSLDSDGYLRRPIDTLIDDRAMSIGKLAKEEDMREALNIVQSLDPAGIGAQDLRECMLLQLKRMPLNDEIKNAITIVDKMFEVLTKKQYDTICKKLGLSQAELSPIIDIIHHLNPKPGGAYGDSAESINQCITPDFIVDNDNGHLSITLNNANLPELRVSSEYNNMVKDYIGNKNNRNAEMKKAIQFAKQKIDAANWFIDAIKQRNTTLLATMKAIVSLQKDYFLDGDERKLKPMKLKDVADIVGYDVSTISRVSNSKYVQTEWGLLPLKHFFSESMYTTEGEEISNKEIKNMIREAVDKEDKSNPITDDILANIMKEKGYVVARRTIAKYREQMNIPVARLRKKRNI